jgi:uncharacterized protein YbjT (DUF2867 family)
MFKHTIFIPQIYIVYFCRKFAYMDKKAVLAGASGLIGSALLDILLSQPGYDDVLILVRAELPVKHQKLKQLVIDFDKLADYTDQITGYAIFCCLGTTRKKTPDLNTYRKIDHDYPLQLAQIGAKNKVEQFHLVSSLGANARSSHFYLKTKGETETDIIKSGMRSVHIYQPSLLTGDRKEKRIGEKFLFGLMKAIDLLLFGSLKKYRSIPATTVAMAMFKQSLINNVGVFVHPSDKIKELS